MRDRIGEIDKVEMNEKELIWKNDVIPTGELQYSIIQLLQNDTALIQTGFISPKHSSG